MTESGARLWAIVCEEALLRSQSEPVLASFYHASVLNHASLEEALACVLAIKLEAGMVPAMVLRDVLGDALCSDPEIGEAVCADLHAYRTRDPACDSFVTPFLNYKGFHALQTYRVAHWLWQGGRMWLAHLLQSRCSVRFAVDIHPGAVLGQRHHDRSWHRHSNRRNCPRGGQCVDAARRLAGWFRVCAG